MKSITQFISEGRTTNSRELANIQTVATFESFDISIKDKLNNNTDVDFPVEFQINIETTENNKTFSKKYFIKGTFSSQNIEMKDVNIGHGQYFRVIPTDDMKFVVDYQKCEIDELAQDYSGDTEELFRNIALALRDYFEQDLNNTSGTMNNMQFVYAISKKDKNSLFDLIFKEFRHHVGSHFNKR